MGKRGPKPGARLTGPLRQEYIRCPKCGFNRRFIIHAYAEQLVEQGQYGKRTGRGPVTFTDDADPNSVQFECGECGIFFYPAVSYPDAAPGLPDKRGVDVERGCGKRPGESKGVVRGAAAGSLGRLLRELAFGPAHTTDGGSCD